jgi:hypothetical protein
VLSVGVDPSDELVSVLVCEGVAGRDPLLQAPVLAE